MTLAQTPPCLLAFKKVLDDARSLSCSSVEEQHAKNLLEDVRAALRSFHGVQESDGLLYLRVLAKELYELTIVWANRISCKQLVDLKLLSCRLQEYACVSAVCVTLNSAWQTFFLALLKADMLLWRVAMAGSFER